MVVRVCKEMDEYYHYGGPPGSAGYWASYKDELVFPDLSRPARSPTRRRSAFMHHEAFHQYIYYALLKHNPPVWFNEGYAEYFFTRGVRRGSKLKFMKRHPMRYGTVKSALGAGKLIPLKDFMKLTHRQYMQQATLCYAQGWAFATWLKNDHEERALPADPRHLLQGDAERLPRARVGRRGDGLREGIRRHRLGRDERGLREGPEDQARSLIARV